MSLREVYAGTHHASLEWKENEEKAIDRVAAAGRCDDVGVMLWKAKYVLESSALISASKRLREMFIIKFPNAPTFLRDAIVEQSLREYLDDKCHTCGGRGSVMTGDVKVVCDKCDGHGMHIYTDQHRSRMMKVSHAHVTSRPFRRQIAWVSDLITKLDNAVQAEMIMQLERRGG